MILHHWIFFLWDWLSKTFKNLSTCLFVIQTVGQFQKNCNSLTNSFDKKHFFVWKLVFSNQPDFDVHIFACLLHPTPKVLEVQKILSCCRCLIGSHKSSPSTLGKNLDNCDEISSTLQIFINVTYVFSKFFLLKVTIKLTLIHWLRLF